MKGFYYCLLSVSLIAHISALEIECGDTSCDTSKGECCKLYYNGTGTYVCDSYAQKDDGCFSNYTEDPSVMSGFYCPCDEDFICVLGENMNTGYCKDKS